MIRIILHQHEIVRGICSTIIERQLVMNLPVFRTSAIFHQVDVVLRQTSFF